MPTAIDHDGDPNVRAAAATALGRLNDDGRGALSKALGDADPRVKLAALTSAGRVNTFTDVQGVARLTGDGDATVRRRSAELLGAMRAKDAVDGLIALTKDADPGVRNSAAHALGQIRDARAPRRAQCARERSGWARPRPGADRAPPAVSAR